MIRPVEMQMVVQRTDSVSQMQHNENHKVTEANMTATTKVDKNVKEQSETVVKKDENDMLDYRYDAKEKGNNEYQDNRRKDKKDNKDNKSENKKSDVKRVNFDIKI